MPESLSPLKAWETFYFLVGTSAAALIGLQFVVIALIGETGSGTGTGTRAETVAAFGTPTVVHLCAVLVVSALLIAPWASLPAAGLLVALAGAAGLLYAAVVTWRAREQEGYQPVFEDWLFHAILPTLAYGGVMVAGFYVVRRHPVGGLTVLAVSTMLLLLVAIHNAWDTATYITVQRTQGAQSAQGTPGTPPAQNAPSGAAPNA
jgi:hypothetical protein